jgi:hypothetical protein
VSIHLHRAKKHFPTVLGVLALAGTILLFSQDVFPRLFPYASHNFLGAFSLATIAFSYMIFQIVQRATRANLSKAILLAAAFLFWAANQLWPTLPEASLFNDVAIGLFVLDVFLMISGWPKPSSDRSFADGAHRANMSRFSDTCCGRVDCDGRC